MKTTNRNPGENESWPLVVGSFGCGSMLFVCSFELFKDFHEKEKRVPSHTVTHEQSAQCESELEQCCCCAV